MNVSEASKPTISIDLKKYRIRIHKHTLHLLGDPEYIYLLVNPADRIIAVCCGIKSEHLAHHINWKSLENLKSYELYSTNLVQSLHAVCASWKENQSYRIYGEIIPGKRMAQFRMSDSVLVHGSQQN